jgi:DNA invertase Pin-like site-specific DNA recombinase
MNIVIYARYSSHNQREESIEGQIRKCRDFAEKNGFLVVGEYIDRAISGKTDNRAGFQRMIRDSEKGQFDGVLMYTLDRFARNRYDSALYKAKLKRNGVKIFYAEQSIPDGPEGIILESVLEGFAEYYSENLSRNIKRGMEENARQCKCTGGNLALGYRIGPDKKFELDPAGAQIVREIFQLYADGWSATRITEYCNSKGYHTSRGTAFNKNSLRSILCNRKYIGVYSFGDFEVEGGVPQIVDTALFEKVQATFKRNYKARARSKAKVDYLLSTKLFCGHCGAPMIGESGTAKNGSTYNYYKCANRKRNHTCTKQTERKEWIEALVVKETVQRVLTRENIELIAQKAVELLEKEAADTSERDRLEKELRDTDRSLSNLVRLMEQGIYSETTKTRLHELEAYKKDISELLVQERMKKPVLPKERIIHWLLSFRNGDINDVEYQQRVIDTLVNSVFIYDVDGGGRKIVFTFNLSGANTATADISDIEGVTPPLVR